MLGIAAHREIVSEAAALAHHLAAASGVQNPGLARPPGFEWAEVAPGPILGSADRTML